MAAEYTRHCLARGGSKRVAVGSAGLLGIEGAPASAEAIEALAENGLDLSGHRSRGLREVDVRTAGLIVIMTAAHLAEIERRFRRDLPPRLLIRAFERSPRPDSCAASLDDPMGEPLDAYRRCFAIIRTCVDHLVLHLEQVR